MATHDVLQIGDISEVSMPDLEQFCLGMLAETVPAATQDMYPSDQSVGVVQAVADEVAVADAQNQDKFPGAGKLYEEGKHCAVLDEKFEDVGGFSVLKTQALWYRKIWLSCGHIASSKVLTGLYSSQVTVVSEIMTSIIHMDRCHLKDVSSDLIDSWEEKIKVAEKLEFNIGWLRDRFEEIKKRFSEKKKLQETEMELDQAKARVEEAQQKVDLANVELKMARDRFCALDTKISPVRLERQDFIEKCKGHLLLFDCGTGLSPVMPAEEPIDNTNSKTVPRIVEMNAMLDNNSKMVPGTAEASIPGKTKLRSCRAKSEKRKSSGNGTDGCAVGTSLSIDDYLPLPSMSLSPEITSSTPTAKQGFTEDEIVAVLLKNPVITVAQICRIFKSRLTTREDKLAFTDVMQRVCEIHKNEDGKRYVVQKVPDNSKASHGVAVQ